MDNKLNWYHLDLFAEMYTPSFLDDFLDQLQALGCNGILLELADRLHYRSVPDFAAPDALNREEMRRLCDGIRARGMMVVPLLQHLGHLNHLLKHEAYARMREDRSTSYSICPLHPETTPTIQAILSETLDTVGEAPYVHLGGDETYHLGQCDKCAEFVKQHSKSALYIAHYAPLCEMVLQRGQRPVLWHDMVAAHPQSLDDLPRETIFVDWNYQRSAPRASEGIAWHPHEHRLLTAANFERFEPADWRDTFRPYVLHGDGTINPYYPMDFLFDRGFDVILAPACRSWGDSYWFPDNARHYPNLVDTARHVRGSKVLGQCVTDWSVRQAPPGTRMLGIAVGLWGLTDGLDVDAAATRFASEFCGLPDSVGAELLKTSLLLSKQPPFSRPNRIDNTVFQARDLVQDVADVNVNEERSRFPALRDGFVEASEFLSDVLTEAKPPGAVWLAQWLLAADALLLRTSIAEAVLDYTEGNLRPARAQELLRGVDGLEKRTRELLKSIYSTDSLEEHMVVRFAGDRRFLQKAV
jgi:hypothetical protein